MIHLIWVFLKFLFLVMVALLIMGGVFYLVTEIYHQSAIIAFGIIALILGIALFTYFLVHYFRRLRQKKFVENIVAQDDLLLQKSRNDEYARLSELRERWVNAVNTLKSSSLAKKGNPLYVLPWYLIIGETDSGKSSSVGHCGLTSISSQVGPVPGVATTRNCDWWFFENAIVIDTAGKYAVPVDGKIDEIEWKEFLIQVATYRKKEPINGIMVTLPMDKLINGDDDALDRYAVFISERVNRIVKVLNARIPVYVMITKTDLLSGFFSFQSGLSPSDRDSALGYTSKVNENHLSVIDKTFESLRISISQLIMIDDGTDVVRPEIAEAKAGTLLFLENLMLLKDKVRRFVQIAFDNTTYHEKVLLRGLYFSSALQTGESSSIFASEFIEATKQTSTSVGRGMFLKNVFNEIMPKSRGLYQPLVEFLRWRTVTSNLALISLALLTFGFLVYVGYCSSYSESKSELVGAAIRDVQINGITVEGRLDAQFDLIAVIDEIEQSYFYRLQLPFTRRGLDSSLLVAKRYLVNSFRKYNMSRLLELDYWKQRIEKGRNPEMKLSYDTDVQAKRAEAIGDAVLFFSLLEKYYDEVVKEHAGKSVRKDLLSKLKMINSNNLGCGNYASDNCIYIMDRYLDYQDNLFDESAYCNGSKDILNELLKKFNDFRWIIDWGNTKISPVMAGAFLPLTQYPKKQYNFGGAFTKSGYEYIGTLLDLMPKKNAYIDMDMKKRVFMDYYTSNFVNNWLVFIDNFQSVAADAPVAERKSLSSLLSDTKTNPFFKLYDRAYSEFSFISKFIPVNTDYMTIEQIAVLNYTSVGDNSPTSVINDVVAKTSQTKKIASEMDLTSVNSMVKEKIGPAATATHDYFESLKNLVAESSNQQVYNRVVSEYRTQNDAAGSGYEKINKILADLKVNLEPSDQNKSKSKTIIEISGVTPYVQSVGFAERLSIDMVGCHIQQRWENEVISKLSDDNVDLFSDNGLVTKFLEKDMDIFLYSGINGYQIQEVRGTNVRFTPAFINFLNKRTVYKKVLSVTESKINMSTKPFAVNDESRMLPNSAIVTFHCKDKDYKLANYNFSNSLTFNWKKGECDSVSLDIDFDSFSLHKEFNSSNGTADFFALFQGSGYHDFTPGDFPGKENIMDAINLEWIRLNYKIDGAEAVIKSADYSRNSLGVPDEAAECM